MICLLIILSCMVVSFLTEILPIDLTAFLGLLALVAFGYVAPNEAFQGFSSSAVITLLSMFFIGSALKHTGVAEKVGLLVLKYCGSRELSVVMSVMLVSALLSAFMPNVAAVAVLLPVVSSISHRTGISPSKLFMPLCFAAVLGGSSTLIGCTPNILISEFLSGDGLESFSFFDFSFVGAPATLAGILFIGFIGRLSIPQRREVMKRNDGSELRKLYRLNERLFSVRIPDESSLCGKSLGDIQFGTLFGVQVLAIERGGRQQLAPSAQDVIEAGDLLTLRGRSREFEVMLNLKGVKTRSLEPDLASSLLTTRRIIQVEVREDDALCKRRLSDLDLKREYSGIVIGVERNGGLLLSSLSKLTLLSGDVLYLLVSADELLEVDRKQEVRVLSGSALEDFLRNVHVLELPQGSPLYGLVLQEARIGELIGSTILGVVRGVEKNVEPALASTKVSAGDSLIFVGQYEQIRRLAEIGELQFEEDINNEKIFESDVIGVVEAAISPRSELTGKNLSELNFREKYGLQVLAIWRDGEPRRSRLTAFRLRFGDALLLQGAWSHLKLIKEDPDFLILSDEIRQEYSSFKSFIAIFGLLTMIVLSVARIAPIPFSAFTAATIVALGGAVKMEEVYRSIDWRIIFFIACILPVGLALQRSGAADFLANFIVHWTEPAGPVALIISIGLFASVISQLLDATLAVVLLAPVGIQAAEQMKMSPYPIMMVITLCASVAFLTQFSHRANLLVMGAGGYKPQDYFKVGWLLSIIVFIVIFTLTPVFFPL